jgi:hypothetical protein
LGRAGHIAAGVAIEKIERIKSAHRETVVATNDAVGHVAAGITVEMMVSLEHTIGGKAVIPASREAPHVSAGVAIEQGRYVRSRAGERIVSADGATKHIAASVTEECVGTDRRTDQMLVIEDIIATVRETRHVPAGITIECVGGELPHTLRNEIEGVGAAESVAGHIPDSIAIERVGDYKEAKTMAAGERVVTTNGVTLNILTGVTEKRIIHVVRAD